ncbi:MAG: helix-hairpin-helix domain-containing protein [Bacteroides sp.]|nr:helix-hairpin-helix domain-containing protein [Roseburia sp.]MCM1347550.1 helix-hairpin-helix domain-containing protein [Bacteroides sp.]MCM1420602.1 helix-hairpin-helix domain-containing protein [Bacteroides sp.]
MFRNFFYYPKSDRRVIIVLAIVAVCGIAALIAIGLRYEGNAEKEKTLFTPQKEKAHASTEAERRHNGKERQHDGKESTEALHGSTEEIALHSFDPNTVDSSTLVSFGLGKRQRNSLLNYRKAGGVFRTPESVSKLYGWSEEDVERLLPYIRIGERFKVKQKAAFRPSTIHSVRNETADTARSGNRYDSEKFRTLTLIDPNTADSATLRRVPGIGTHISSSIIRYRERLGGFHHVEQLREIKIFSPELLEWFEISSPNISTIHINEASFQKLNSHPYISYEQTLALLKYIRIYGKIEDEKQLSDTNIFTEEEIKRLAPYITF